MKVSARKLKHHLALISPTQSPAGESEFVASGTLRDSFLGWLDAVVPISTRSVTVGPRLTAGDVTRVNQATVREGESHRVWPPYIFEKFWTSEVITEKKVAHYELKDANLRRVI